LILWEIFWVWSIHAAYDDVISFIRFK